MVLEIKAPHEATLSALVPLIPVLLSYVLSFIYVGIYWNNHHHLFQATQRINGAVLWANLHLLFWLSLVPVVTAWMGENHFAAVPVAAYGVVLLMSALAYMLLVHTLMRLHAKDSLLSQAIGRDNKGYASIVLYAVGILLALAGASLWAGGLFALVALMWLLPDRRIERQLDH